MIVAIDGPAGSGKSTIAKLLAHKLSWVYLDTGAMYRCVALATLEAKLENQMPASAIAQAKTRSIRMEPPAHPADLTHVFLDGENVTKAIRTREVDAFVSTVAAIPEVRELLVAQQRSLASEQNSILEGRDTTTVVCPHADVKIFLHAKPKARALRRLKEDYPAYANLDSKEAETLPEYQEILKEIESRDHADETREVSPLRVAPDAIELDSTELGIDEVVAELYALVKERSQ